MQVLGFGVVLCHGEREVRVYAEVRALQNPEGCEVKTKICKHCGEAFDVQQGGRAQYCQLCRKAVRNAQKLRSSQIHRSAMTLGALRRARKAEEEKRRANLARRDAEWAAWYRANGISDRTAEKIGVVTVTRGRCPVYSHVTVKSSYGR